MAEVLTDFPELTTVIAGKEEPIMQRTTLVTNNREHAGDRPGGLHLHRGVHCGVLPGHGPQRGDDGRISWAEALREISGRLAEMPADAGYPAHLGARQASS